MYISAEDVVLSVNNGENVEQAILAIPKVNNSATRNPTNTDDSSQGYSIGSLWVNTLLSTPYLCLSASTGAAVWVVSIQSGATFKWQGSWNAATNTPHLANGTGVAGNFYICTTAGSVDFGSGAIAFAVNDACAYANNQWANAGSAFPGVIIGVKSSPIASIPSGDSVQVTTPFVYPFSTLAYIFSFSYTNDQAAPLIPVEISHNLVSITYNVFNPNNFIITNAVIGITPVISGN